jgi:hypothetical protein
MEGGSGGVWNAQMRQLLQVNGITLLLFLTRVHPMDIISKDI